MGLVGQGRTTEVSRLSDRLLSKGSVGIYQARGRAPKPNHTKPAQRAVRKLREVIVLDDGESQLDPLAIRLSQAVTPPVSSGQSIGKLRRDSQVLELRVFVPEPPESTNITFGTDLPRLIEGSKVEPLDTLALRPHSGLDKVLNSGSRAG